MTDIAERILGGILSVPATFWNVADMLRVEHFTEASHRQIFRLIAEAARAGKSLDAVTLADAHPGLANLAMDLAEAAYSVANLRDYAAILIDRATARTVRATGQRIAALEGSGAECVAEAQTMVAALAHEQAGSGRPIADVVAERAAIIREQMERADDLLGVPTGLGQFDDMTSGLQAGQLIVLGGRPSMCKTLLELQWALHGARNGYPVHIITLEMTAAQCVERMQSNLANVPLVRVRQAKLLTPADRLALAKADALLAAMPVTFDEAIHTLPEILARIRQVHATTGTRVAFIDYLSHIRPPKADTMALAIQEITRQLKQVAKALGIAVVLLSQLNRGVEDRNDKRPQLSDLRESGAIEQDADVAAFMYRDGYYHPGSPHDGFAELLIRKQRNGRTDMVPLLERLDVQRLESINTLPPAPASEPRQLFSAKRSVTRPRPEVTP